MALENEVADLVLPEMLSLDPQDLPLSFSNHFLKKLIAEHLYINNYPDRQKLKIMFVCERELLLMIYSLPKLTKPYEKPLDAHMMSTSNVMGFVGLRNT